jgi:hypothetical protein
MEWGDWKVIGDLMKRVGAIQGQPRYKRVPGAIRDQDLETWITHARVSLQRAEHTLQGNVDGNPAWVKDVAECEVLEALATLFLAYKYHSS